MKNEKEYFNKESDSSFVYSLLKQVVFKSRYLNQPPTFQTSKNVMQHKSNVFIKRRLSDVKKRINQPITAAIQVIVVIMTRQRIRTQRTVSIWKFL